MTFNQDVLIYSVKPCFQINSLRKCENRKSPTIPLLNVGNISLATSSSKTLENYLLFTKPCSLPVNNWHVASSPHQLFWHVHMCLYTHMYIYTLIYVNFSFPFTQDRILFYHTLYVSVNWKKRTRSTTLTWFWGSAQNISIKPHLLKELNTVLTSNIRISKAVCQGTCTSISGEFNGPQLTNKSNNVSSTPNLYQIVPDCSSV